MAATNKTGNLVYSDQGSISIDSNIIMGLVIHCTHASNPAIIILGDDISGTSYPTLFSIEVPAANDNAFFDFSGCPLRFPNGIRIKTVTDAEITIITAQGIK
jgi:hypothetical protein